MGSLDLVGPLGKEIKLYIKPLPYYRPASFRFHFLDFKLLLSYKIRCFLPYGRMQMACHQQELRVLSELGRVPLAIHLHFAQELVVVETYHTQPSPFFQRIAAQDAKTRERERERDSLLVGCVKFSRKPKIWEFTTKIKNIILKKRQGKSNHLTLGVFFFFGGGVECSYNSWGHIQPQNK